MTSHDTTTDFDAFMCRFFAGEATVEEKQSLLDWARSSEANRQKLQDARTAYIASKHQAAGPRFDGQRAFAHFNRDTRKASIPLWKKMSVAACVVVVIGLGIAFWTHSPSPTANTIIMYSSGTNLDMAVNLPDGSHVVLRHGAELAYDVSSTSGRSLTLRGEAFFDVVHDAQKPFTITIDDLAIKVLGTSFIVESVSDSGYVSVKVIAGRVMMACGTSSIIVTKDQAGLYYRGSKELSGASTYDKNDIAWKTNTLSFSGTPMSVVAAKLSRYFNREIVIGSPQLASVPLSVELDSPNLDSVLQLLQLTFGLDVQQSDSTIILTQR